MRKLFEYLGKKAEKIEKIRENQLGILKKSLKIIERSLKKLVKSAEN